MAIDFSKYIQGGTSTPVKASSGIDFSKYITAGTQPTTQTTPHVIKIPGGGALYSGNYISPSDTGHTTYGGEPVKSGQQRDDYIPVGLGGVNQSPENIRYEPTTLKAKISGLLPTGWGAKLGLGNKWDTATDPIEKKNINDYKSGKISLDQARTNVIVAKVKQAQPWGESSNWVKNIIATLPSSVEKVRSALQNAIFGGSNSNQSPFQNSADPSISYKADPTLGKTSTGEDILAKTTIDKATGQKVVLYSPSLDKNPQLKKDVLNNENSYIIDQNLAKPNITSQPTSKFDTLSSLGQKTLEEIPATLGKIVGAVTGTVGGLVGGLVGLVGSKIKQDISTLKTGQYNPVTETKNAFNSMIKSAVDTAKFGNTQGQGTGQMALKLPEVGVKYATQTIKGINNTITESYNVYQQNKETGGQHPLINAVYQGLKSGGSEGLQLIGMSKADAENATEYPLIAALGNVMLYGSAYTMGKEILGSEKPAEEAPQASETPEITTSEKPLYEEAKKYKSAEEFVKNKDVFYHGTDSNSAKLIEQGGFKLGKSEISPLALKAEPVFLTKNKADAQTFANALAERNGTKPVVLEVYADKGVAKLGKDKIDYEVWNPENLKTKSQLTDIWNKAQVRNFRVEQGGGINTNSIYLKPNDAGGDNIIIAKSLAENEVISDKLNELPNTKLPNGDVEIKLSDKTLPPTSGETPKLLTAPKDTGITEGEGFTMKDKSTPQETQLAKAKAAADKATHSFTQNPTEASKIKAVKAKTLFENLMDRYSEEQGKSPTQIGQQIQQEAKTGKSPTLDSITSYKPDLSKDVHVTTHNSLANENILKPLTNEEKANIEASQPKVETKPEAGVYKQSGIAKSI
jgi:hypothetical protein